MAKEKSLTEQLSDAMTAGDMRLVISLAKNIADDERKKERELAETNKGAIADMTGGVMRALEKVVNDNWIEHITRLVGFDDAGVIFKMVPADKILQCKITTKAVKSGGCVGGGSYNRTGLAGVKELLTQYGDTIVGKDYLGGKFVDDTWQAAYDSNPDKNFRYAVLRGLRKVAGLV